MKNSKRKKREQEIWSEIEEFKDVYISSFGRVKRILNGNTKHLSIYHNRHRMGYGYVTIERSGARKTLLVHRLVAKAFIPNKNNLPVVNHIDFDTSNNHHSNLWWVTHKENTQHSIRNNRFPEVSYGEKSVHSTLNDSQVLDIVKERLELGTKYIELAEKYNTKYSNIAHIMRGTRWGKVTGIKYKQK